jgi:hypothetical protein
MTTSKPCVTVDSLAWKIYQKRNMASLCLNTNLLHPNLDKLKILGDKLQLLLNKKVIIEHFDSTVEWFEQNVQLNNELNEQPPMLSSRSTPPNRPTINIKTLTNFSNDLSKAGKKAMKNFRHLANSNPSPTRRDFNKPQLHEDHGDDFHSDTRILDIENQLYLMVSEFSSLIRTKTNFLLHQLLDKLTGMIRAYKAEVGVEMK